MANDTVEEQMEWLVNEIMDLRQENEELRIELMLSESEIMPKWKMEACRKALTFKNTGGNF